MMDANSTLITKGPLLTAENIHSFRGKQKVLSDINFWISEGEFVCLCGPNGCGKSTLFSVLSALKSEGLKTKGEVYFQGKNIKKMKAGERARKISILLQNENCVWDFYVEDVILSGRYPWNGGTSTYSDIDREKVHDIMESLGIKKLSGKKIFQISGGEWQKVRIARILVQDAKVMLLDESLANLDFGFENEMLDFLKNYAISEKKGICLTLHDLNIAARFASRICFLPKGGQLISGTVNEVYTAEVLEAVYGKRFNIFEHPELKIPQVWA